VFHHIIDQQDIKILFHSMRLILTLINTEDPPYNNEFTINQLSEMTKKIQSN